MKRFLWIFGLLLVCRTLAQCPIGCNDGNVCTEDKCSGSVCVYNTPAWNKAKSPPGECCLQDEDCKKSEKCSFGVCDVSQFKCIYLSTCNQDVAAPESEVADPFQCQTSEDCMHGNSNICLVGYCNAGQCGFNMRVDIKGCCNTDSDCPVLPCRGAACDTHTMQCVWSAVTPVKGVDCNQAIPSDFFRIPNGAAVVKPVILSSNSTATTKTATAAKTTSSSTSKGPRPVAGTIVGFIILGLLILFGLLFILLLVVRQIIHKTTNPREHTKQQLEEKKKEQEEL